MRRIVYLGGLGEGPGPSPHLAGRQEVGRILAVSGVETLELRAAIVIGSGGTSFEMVRALVDRLPVMVTPRWVGTRTQPIAIEDVVEYLPQGAGVPLDGSRVVGIGGPDRVSYGDIVREYARRRGLRRLMVPVPVLTPRLSSLWLGLVTPVYARVGRELSSGPRPRAFGGAARGSRLLDSRVARVPLPPERAFAPSSGSAVARAGTTATPSGACAGSSTCPSAAPARAAGAATRCACCPATRSTSCAWRRSSGTGSCAWWPR